jgi:uncharacterized membrane protein
MMDKALMGLAAAAAIAAAAAVGVVAIAFAVYAGSLPWVGPAWAATIVAVLMILIVVVAGLMVRGRASGGRRHKADEPDASMVQKIMAMAKERPILAAGVALGAGVYAIRNPKLIAALAAAFMEGRQSTR